MKLDKSEEFKLIEIKAKEQSYNLLSGNHLSKIYGEGYDFGELREYQIGDDIRNIESSRAFLMTIENDSSCNLRVSTQLFVR